MKIKNSVVQTCDKCNLCTGILEDEVHGCDNCKKKITRDLLEAEIFYHNSHNDSKHLEFCSWKCAIKMLKKQKTDYFISLPYLMFNTKEKGAQAKDFFAMFKKL